MNSAYCMDLTIQWCPIPQQANVRYIMCVPECDVSSALEYVREVAPEEAQPLLNYFDSTYVSGSTISTVGRERHIPPLFQPAIWNVFHSTLNGQ